MAWQTLDQQYREQNTQNDRSNYLKDIIAGLSIANNNDPKTLLGYGLGRWLSNYVNRGLERRQQDKNTKGYDEWMNGVNKAAGDALPTVQGRAIQGPDQQQMDMPFVSQTAQQIAAEMYPDYKQQAIQSAMPNTDWLNAAREQQQSSAAPSVSPQAKQIANQILGAERQYAQRYDMTSEEVYNNAYRIARQNGSTETQARQFAQQKAAEYQPQRVTALSNAFINSGVNPDGTINNQGVAMLAQLAQENPKQTKMLGNMYQTPLGATQYAQEIAKMMQNSNLHLQNAKELANLNFTNSQRAAEAQIARQNAARMEAANYARSAAAQQAYQDAISKNMPEAQAIQYAQQMGDIAYAMSMAGNSGGGRSGGTRGGNGGRSNSNSEGRSRESILKEMKSLKEQGTDGMGEWIDEELKAEHERLKREYLHYGETPIDVSDPKQVANMVRSGAKEQNRPEWEILDFIKENYPGADIEGARKILGLSTNPEEGLGEFKRINAENPQSESSEEQEVEADNGINWGISGTESATGTSFSNSSEDPDTYVTDEQIAEAVEKYKNSPFYRRLLVNPNR